MDVESQQEEAKGHAAAQDLGLEELSSHMFSRLLVAMDHDIQPYFIHLTTRVFLKRLVRSLVPATRYDDLLAQPDLYASVVLTFVLASIVHFDLKSADPKGHSLLATSLLFCFASLICASLMLDVAWQFCAVMKSDEEKKKIDRYGLDRAICITGYSFFGPCIVMLLLNRVPFVLFALLSAVIELGASLSYGAVAFRASQTQSPALGATAVMLHIVWLIVLVRFV